MMKAFLVLVTVTLAAADMFEIDELQKMVSSYTDRAQLEVLDDDRYTPRAQIQQSINEILQRQSQDVQNAYNTILQGKQARDQIMQQRHIERMRTRGASEQLISTQQQIYAIKNDTSLSRQQAKDQIRSLKRNMSWTDREMIGY